jgi:hypothetical protein
LEFYEGLQRRLAIEGERHDFEIRTHLVTADEVEAGLTFLDEQKNGLGSH